MFDLKTKPWFIKTETPEQRIAAQEWLFEKGLRWQIQGSQVLNPPAAKYFMSSQLFRGFFVWGDNKPLPDRQEIKLTYETKVTAVEWPTINTKADKLRAKIAKLQAKLAEIEG